MQLVIRLDGGDRVEGDNKDYFVLHLESNQATPGGTSIVLSEVLERGSSVIDLMMRGNEYAQKHGFDNGYEWTVDEKEKVVIRRLLGQIKR